MFASHLIFKLKSVLIMACLLPKQYIHAAFYIQRSTLAHFRRLSIKFLMKTASAMADVPAVAEIKIQKKKVETGRHATCNLTQHLANLGIGTQEAHTKKKFCLGCFDLNGAALL